MTATRKNVLIGIACLTSAVLLLGSAIFYILNTRPFLLEKYLPRFLNKYVELYVNKRLPPGTAIINMGQLSEDWAAKKYIVVLPKSKVSSAYHETLNLVFNELYLMEKANKDEMSQSFAELMRTTREKTGMENSSTSIAVAKIRDLNEMQKKREVIIASYLNNLSSINSKLTDGETVKLTTDFVVSARKTNEAYIAYSLWIDELIAGKATEKTVANLKTIVDNIAASATDLNNKTNKLLSFFLNALNEDIKNTSTSTTPL